MAINLTPFTPPIGQPNDAASRNVGAANQQAARLARRLDRPGSYKLDLNKIYSFLNTHKGQVTGDALKQLQQLASEKRRIVRQNRGLGRIPGPDARR